MRIGIYDPYLNSLSGGEKYMLTAAACLSYKYKATIFWDDPKVLEMAQRKLRIDLSKTIVKPNIFSSKVSVVSRLLETAKYDRLIFLSDGSIPLTLAKKTILHFQFPVEWVKVDDIRTKIKLLKISSIICNSIFTKKFIDKKFNINSKVLYPPCVNSDDIDKFSMQIKFNEKKNIILTVGRYSPLPARPAGGPKGGSIKKQEEMIKVFQKMVDNGLNNWKLYVAISFLKENEKYLEEVEKTIKNYPIKIIKNSNFSELEKLYSDAKIYWHAAGFGEDLEKHPERAEHFGITTVEAMAHKVIPVVYARGGQPEIVDNNINGFLWETEQELMQKTKKIITDNLLMEQMGNLGLKKARLYTSERFCEELQKIIK